MESVLESTLLAGFLLISAVALWGVALTAGGSSWIEYGHLFDESKLVHVTTVDFWLLTAFAPFWMYNDAQLRGWKPRWAASSRAHTSLRSSSRVARGTLALPR